jgi:CheY-like chemotaxis protein
MEDPTPRSPPPLRPPHVLLAEDDEAARSILARALRELGMVVEELVDGGRLLVSVASQYRDGHTPEDVDLIVSDVNMPVCSGLQVFRGVRAAHWLTPVLLMTAYPTAEVRDTATQLGARLLVKPFDLDAFEQAVLELVAVRYPAFSSH